MKKSNIAILMMVAAFFAAASCGKVEEGNTSTELTISVDTPVIRSNGQSAATIVVKLGNEVVTEGVTIYDADTDTPVQIPDFKFTTTKAGVYSFWASYKTFSTSSVTVTAITSPLPHIPEDPQPSNTSFKKKVFVTDFTGTGCQYCPQMMENLDRMAEVYPDQFVLTACHTFNQDDPAFLDYSIDNAMSVGSYPTVVLNLDKTKKANLTTLAKLKSMFEEDYGDGKVGVGISVATVVDELNLVVKAQIKVAKAGKYRVGAWLMEDGIIARQSGAGSEPIEHNHCVRDIYSKNSASDYSGTLHFMEAGQTDNQFFLAKLDPEWKTWNCHVAVFVCAPAENGNYVVTNVVDCPLGKSVEYSYAE